MSYMKAVFSPSYYMQKSLDPIIIIWSSHSFLHWKMCPPWAINNQKSSNEMAIDYKRYGLKTSKKHNSNTLINSQKWRPLKTPSFRNNDVFHDALTTSE